MVARGTTNEAAATAKAKWGKNTPNAVVLVEWDVEFREHQVFSQPTAIPLNPHLYLSENAHNGWNMVHSGYGQFMQQQANTP